MTYVIADSQAASTTAEVQRASMTSEEDRQLREEVLTRLARLCAWRCLERRPGDAMPTPK